MNTELVAISWVLHGIIVLMDGLCDIKTVGEKKEEHFVKDAYFCEH